MSRPSYPRSKRLFDLLTAAAIIAIAAPLMLSVAAAVRIGVGRPVLFRQRRPGLNAIPFDLVKFRTMSEARNADGTLKDDAQRMTALGRWLRRTSLDELPELFNVLRGEMSLVGPRPLLMQYVERYSPDQARRHHLPPGITGLAQVSGRNLLAWEERFELDVWYVDHWSFLLDMKILARTVVRLFAPQGVKHEGHVSMPKFRGSNRR